MALRRSPITRNFPLPKSPYACYRENIRPGVQPQSAKSTASLEHKLTVDNLRHTFEHHLPKDAFLIKCSRTGGTTYRGHFNEFERMPTYAVTSYDAGGKVNPKSHPRRKLIGKYHAIPGLPIPQAKGLSASDYLDWCVGSEGGPSWTAAHVGVMSNAMMAREFGVAVLVLGHEQACHFVTRFQPGMNMEFVRQPVQFINDALIGIRSGNGSINEQQVLCDDIMRSFFSSVWKSVSTCPSFRQATTWWYRLDETAKTILSNDRTLLPSTAEQCSAQEGDLDLVSASDPRWTQLPSVKLLRNLKWNDKPEYLAKEMRYGLLELY